MSSSIWSLISLCLFVTLMGVSFGFTAFRWNYILFEKVAGPSDGLANAMALGPALGAFFAISLLIAAGLFVTLNPSNKFRFLASSSTNFISSLGGVFAGGLATYSYVQQTLLQPLTPSTRFRTALSVTMNAPAIFVIVGIVVALIFVVTIQKLRNKSQI